MAQLESNHFFDDKCQAERKAFRYMYYAVIL